MSNPHNNISTLIHALGWSLLHSVWQGLLIYILLVIAVKLMPRMPAYMKYNLGIVSLGLIFIWYVGTFFSEWIRLQPIVENNIIVIRHPAISKIGVINFQTSGIDSIYNIFPKFESYLPLLAGIYVLGLIVLSSRLTYNLYLVKRLRSSVSVAPPIELLHKMLQSQGLLNIKRVVRLSFSDKINTAIVIGIFKPLILLPVAMMNQLTIDELESIIIHELGHIKRHDYLLNIIQTVVETIMFFNPFVWLISSIVRREREHCCDDIVIASTVGTLPYAKALITLETYRAQNSSLVLAATGNKNLLFNRIKRIMEMKKNSISYGQLAITILVMLCFVVSLVWLTPAIAQSKKDKNKADKSAVAQKKSITIIDENGDTRVYTSPKDISPKDKEKLKQMGMRFDEKGDLHKKDISISTDSFQIMLNNKIDTNSEHVISNVSQSNGYTPEDIKEIEKAMDAIGIDIAEADKQTRNSHKVIVIHKKQIAEADNQIAAADKQIAEADRVLAEADRQLAKADKVLMEADKRMAGTDITISDAQKQMEQAEKEMAVAEKQFSDFSKEQKEVSNARKQLKDAELDKSLAKEYDQLLAAQKQLAKAEKQLKEASTAVPANSILKNAVAESKYDDVIASMVSEGLINKSKPYTIKKMNGNLYINGELQAETVYQEYKDKLKGDFITIIHSN